MERRFWVDPLLWTLSEVVFNANGSRDDWEAAWVSLELEARKIM